MSIEEIIDETLSSDKQGEEVETIFTPTKKERYLFVTCEHGEGGEILLFCRNEDNKKVCKVIADFLYYFYVREEAEVPEHPDLVQVDDGFKSLFEEPLKKISMKTAGAVKRFRNQFDKHWEADIPSLVRFLVDTGIKGYFLAPKRQKISWREIEPVAEPS